MAKAKGNGKLKFPTTQKKEVEFITDEVQVGVHSTELPVKVDVNCVNATFKITATITTKQVHPTTTEIRDAIAENLKLMIRQAMDLGIERRRFWLEETGEDPDQLTLGFDDDSGE